jgi:hypothetical protein
VSYQLRPRSASEILDVAIQIIKQHFPQLAAISVLAYVPVMIAAGVFGASIAKMNFTSLATGRITPELGATIFAVFAILGVCMMLGVTLANATITVLVSETYLGHETGAGSALRRALSRTPALIGAMLIQMVVFFVAAVASMPFVLLGPLVLFAMLAFVLVALGWCFAMPATVVLEGRGPIESFSRSRSLTQGSLMRVIGVLVVAWIAIYVVSMVVNIIGMIIAGLIHIPMLGFAIAMVAQVLIYPLLGVIITLLYYDLRIRREGFDIEMMANELGADPRMRPVAGV